MRQNQNMKHTKFINFKELRDGFPPDMILWIKFYDNNERTIKNISFPSTIAQMYFKKMPVKASLKYPWDCYQELLAKSFKDKWKIARIYSVNNEGPEDYIVQYLSSGEVDFREKSKSVGGLRIDFESEKVKRFEKAKENTMELYLIKIRHNHA